MAAAGDGASLRTGRGEADGGVKRFGGAAKRFGGAARRLGVGARPARGLEVSDVDCVRVGVARLPGNDDLPLPEYMSDGASGMDLPAAVREPVTIPPGEVVHVPTGIAVEVPPGHEGQVRSRSGLALRHGVFVLNGPGTVDSDYRGEVGVVLANFGREAFVVRRGDRVAQLVIAEVSRAEWVESEDLRPSARQEGGFGHTGGHGEPTS